MSDSELDLALSDSDEEPRPQRRLLRSAKRGTDPQQPRDRASRRQRVLTDSTSSSEQDSDDTDADFVGKASSRPRRTARARRPPAKTAVTTGLTVNTAPKDDAQSAVPTPCSSTAVAKDEVMPQTIPLQCDLLIINSEPKELACAELVGQPSSSVFIETVHISGFKNFRDDVEVRFSPAFTCVVGPNGAGKSSILDAISFVFGGKTADLRGSSLSNLVNDELLQRCAANESQTAVTAKVTVNMQAANHKIAVSRRIVVPDASQVSTARSDYSLNGKKRSRSDINKLLCEHGINMDIQSRFILLQSRTVNIIRQGPVQLLDYVEEIVGTLQIRSQIDRLRQQESSHQLQIEELKVSLTDVASKREELLPKVNDFESYTSVTAEYLCRCTLHLLKNEIVCAYQIDRAEEVRKDCEHQQVTAESKLTKFVDELRAGKTTLTKAKRNAVTAKRRVEKAEEAEQECKCEKRKLSVQRRRAEKTATEAQETVKTMNAKVLELKATDKKLCSSTGSLTNDINTLSSQLESTQVSEHSLSGEDFQKMKMLRTSLADFQRKIKQSNKGQLIAQLSQADARCSELAEVLRLADQKHDKLVQAQSQAQTMLDASLSTKEDLNASENQLQQQLMDLKRKAQGATAVVCHLQQLSQDSRAGRLRAAVLELSQKHAGVRGLLCDLGGCQRQHEEAANTVLGATLGTTVVVDTRRDGILVTDYFREHRIGVVSCSILSEIKELPSATMAEKLQQSNPTQLVNLEDVIQCLPIYKPIWRRVCAGWCIALSQGAAVQFSKQCNVVTTAGVIFKYDGEMRGSTNRRGHAQHDTNALLLSSTSLQRPSLYEAGSKSSGDIVVQLAEADAALATVKTQIDQKHTETIATGVQKRQAVSQTKQAEKKLARLEAQLLKSHKALTISKNEQERGLEVSNQLQEAVSEVERVVESAETTERQIEQLRCPLGDLVELRALREEMDSKSTALQKQNDQLQRVQAALRSLRKEVTKQEKKQTIALKNLGSVNSALLELETTQAEASHSKQNACKLQADADYEVSALEDVVQEQKTKLSVLQVEHAAHVCVLEDAQREEKQLRHQRHVTEQELEKTFDEVANNLPAVRIEVEAMPELELGRADSKPLLLATAAHEAVASRLDRNDEDEMTREMAEEQEAIAVLVKQRKEAWKHVDMQAVDEHRNLVIQEGALTTKQSDAYKLMEELSSKREAQQALREKRFSQGMKKVNSETARLYKELSVHGDICLSAPVSLDANSIAEGVQMFCKETLISPAWKPVELLSGGQQALAALALTLGMSAVYPCPFYCVDEIDAALDTRAVAAVARVVERLASSPPAGSSFDSNCTRVAAAGDRKPTACATTAESCGAAAPAAAPRSQFVVVSHRPQMYERAQRLIGVYTEGGQQRGASTTCGWNAPRRA